MVSKKYIWIFIWFMYIPVFVTAAPLQYLERVVENQTSFDPNLNLSKWNNPKDNGFKNMKLGFSFPFNGATYTKLNVSTNGALTFENNGDFSPDNAPLPSSRNISIYPYWDDLNPSKDGAIKYGKLGTGVNERFVISWEEVPHSSASGIYSFQVVLYASGKIRFRYDADSDVDGSGATIGVQETGTYYDEYSYNSAIDPTKDVVYNPLPEMSITKSSCVIYDPVNIATNPKRIPSATIRYAFEVIYIGSDDATNVIVEDDLSTYFDHASIQNLQIQNGSCECLNAPSASNNGVNGTTNGVNPVTLDFGTVAVGSGGTPTVKCGYLEVDIN